MVARFKRNTPLYVGNIIVVALSSELHICDTGEKKRYNNLNTASYDWYSWIVLPLPATVTPVTCSMARSAISVILIPHYMPGEVSVVLIIVSVVLLHH